uniref:AF4/FMR2 family member lilli n=1 Tax=Panagrellus redivivus TaxID=6233 RepID=A0A7E4VWT0_PANRE
MAFSFAASGDAELRIKLDIDLCDASEKRRRRAPSIAASLLSNSTQGSGFRSNADYAAELKAQDDLDIRKRNQLLKETQDFMAYLQQKYNLNPSQPEQMLLGKVVPRIENNGALNPKIDGLAACLSGSSLKGYTVPFDSNAGISASSRTVFENEARSRRDATARPAGTSSSSTTNSGFTPLPYESTTSNSRISAVSMSSSELNRIRKPVNASTDPSQSGSKNPETKNYSPWKFAHNFTCVPDHPPEVASFRSSSSPLPEIRKAFSGFPPASASGSSSSVGTSQSSLNLTSASDFYKGITPGVTAKESSSQTSMASTQSASSGNYTFPTASFSIPDGIASGTNASPVVTTLSATTYASLPTGATMSASQRSNAPSPSSSQVFPNAKVTIPEGLAINECEIHVVAQSPASKSALTDNTQSETNTRKKL